MGSLYPSFSDCCLPHFSIFYAEGGIAFLLQVVTSFRLRLIAAVRGESYDGDHEDTSTVTRALEEVTLTLSISDWLDDFINHQPRDEFCVWWFFFVCVCWRPLFLSPFLIRWMIL